MIILELHQSHFFIAVLDLFNSQPAITCSKLAIETLEQGVKHAQSSQ